MKKITLFLLMLASQLTHAQTWFDVQLNELKQQHDLCKSTKSTSDCDNFRNTSKLIVPFGRKDQLINEKLLTKEINERNVLETVEILEKVELLQIETAPSFSGLPSLSITKK